MPTEKKYCVECNEEIHGRRDKKYCSDYCRVHHFNNHHGEISNYMRRVNNRIRKNRNILSEFNPNGKAKMHKDKLLDAGLNFDYFTNVYRTRAGKVYYFCYDQGYLALDDNYYALVVKEGYVG